MYIRVDEIPIERIGRSRHSSKRVIICICDTCHAEYAQKYTKPRLLRLQQPAKLTFCSINCTSKSRSRGGDLHKQVLKNTDFQATNEAIKKTMMKRYGVINAGQMKDHVKKTSKTLQERYGVTNALQLPISRQRMHETNHTLEADAKRKETNIKNWGTVNVFSSKEIQGRIKQTLLTKHGVEHSSQIPGITEKRKQTYSQTHSCDHPFKELYVREKIQKTFIERYEAPTYWQSKEHHNRCNSVEFRTLTSNRVKLQCQNPEFFKKRHETMKRNGTYGKSGPEDRLYEALITKFPTTQRQAHINGWSIDFYIPEINIYVQLDGVYWHGLNRPIELIQASLNPRDKVILTTIERDKRQNLWFKEQGIKLLRFTDKQSTTDIVEQIQLLIPLKSTFRVA